MERPSQGTDEFVRGAEEDRLTSKLLLLINLFARLPSKTIWQLGLAVLILSVPLGVWLEARTAGPFNEWVGVAAVYEKSVYRRAGVQVALAWVVAAVLYWAAGRLFSRCRPQRLEDYLAATALALAPYLLQMVRDSNVIWQHLSVRQWTAPPEQALNALPYVLLGEFRDGLGSILFLWSEALFYFALKECSGLKWHRALAVWLLASALAMVVVPVVLHYVPQVIR